MLLQCKYHDVADVTGSCNTQFYAVYNNFCLFINEEVWRPWFRDKRVKQSVKMFLYFPPDVTKHTLFVQKSLLTHNVWYFTTRHFYKSVPGYHIESSDLKKKKRKKKSTFFTQADRNKIWWSCNPAWFEMFHFVLERILGNLTICTRKLMVCT